MEYGGAASVDEDISCLRGDKIETPGFIRAADILPCWLVYLRRAKWGPYCRVMLLSFKGELNVEEATNQGSDVLSGPWKLKVGWAILEKDGWASSLGLSLS